MLSRQRPSRVLPTSATSPSPSQTVGVAPQQINVVGQQVSQPLQPSVMSQSTTVTPPPVGISPIVRRSRAPTVSESPQASTGASVSPSGSIAMQRPRPSLRATTGIGVAAPSDGQSVPRAAGERARRPPQGLRGPSVDKIPVGQVPMEVKRAKESDLYDLIGLSMPYYPYVLVYIPSANNTLRDDVYKFYMKVNETYDPTMTMVKPVITLHLTSESPWIGYTAGLDVRDSQIIGEDRVVLSLQSTSVKVTTNDIEQMIQGLDTSADAKYMLLIEDRDSFNLPSSPLMIGTSRVVGVIARDSPRITIAGRVEDYNAAMRSRTKDIGGVVYRFNHTIEKKILESEWLNTVIEVTLKTLAEVFIDEVQNTQLLEDMSTYMKKSDHRLVPSVMAKVFTHASFTVNNENNYEVLELEGDALMRSVYIFIMRSDPSVIADPSLYTQLLTKYMSKTNQSKIASRYGLHRIVRGLALNHNSDQLKEDVIEAFTSGLFNSVMIMYNDYMYAHAVIVQFLKKLYDITEGVKDSTASQNLLMRDPKTQVQSFFDKFELIEGGSSFKKEYGPEIVTDSDGNVKYRIVVRGKAADAVRRQSQDRILIGTDGVMLLSVLKDTEEEAWDDAMNKLERSIGFINMINKSIRQQIGSNTEINAKYDEMLRVYSQIDVQTMSGATTGSSIFYSMLIGKKKDAQQFEIIDREPGPRRQALIEMIRRWSPLQ